MADEEPIRPEEDDSYQSGDSDLDDGDTVLTRGWDRNHKNLAKNGFRPVWTSSDGYPETPIPSDIMEYLNDDGTCPGARFVGPLRSLAWLVGLDELVEAVDSPAFTINDRIETVPFGADLKWAVEGHFEEGTISKRIADRVFTDRPWTFDQSAPMRKQDQCPEGITDKPTLFSLRDITGISRLQRPSEKILCARIKSHKKAETFERQINQMVDGMFQSGRFWFRALSVSALNSTLAFFIPHTSGNNRDNEFGPGFYTTESLSYSFRYIQGGVGAIMVFKDPALARASVWQPSLPEWEAWVARSLSRPLTIAQQPAPPQYDTADFIQGPIRDTQARPRSTHRQVPVQSNETQLVAVSYAGCKILADSLHFILFVDTT
ncbi:unnamed protein product [Penicillium salamii]|nr:unnamed protein product [Penicillium salamii]CAG8315793.1 unnamed protein product [Penicillium salamii]